MICDCECSKNSEENSTKCTSQGTYTCGSCKCNQGREGDKCQCNQYDPGDISSCRHSNVTDKICSDFGICECGVCKCFVREVRKVLIQQNTFLAYSSVNTCQFCKCSFSLTPLSSFSVSYCYHFCFYLLHRPFAISYYLNAQGREVMKAGGIRSMCFLFSLYPGQLGLVTWNNFTFFLDEATLDYLLKSCVFV